MKEATTKPMDPFFYQTLFISHYPSSYQPIYIPTIHHLLSTCDAYRHINTFFTIPHACIHMQYTLLLIYACIQTA